MEKWEGIEWVNEWNGIVMLFIRLATNDHGKGWGSLYALVDLTMKKIKQRYSNKVEKEIEVRK